MENSAVINNSHVCKSSVLQYLPFALLLHAAGEQKDPFQLKPGCAWKVLQLYNVSQRRFSLFAHPCASQSLTHWVGRDYYFNEPELSTHAKYIYVLYAHVCCCRQRARVLSVLVNGQTTKSTIGHVLRRASNNWLLKRTRRINALAVSTCGGGGVSWFIHFHVDLFVPGGAFIFSSPTWMAGCISTLTVHGA